MVLLLSHVGLSGRRATKKTFIHRENRFRFDLLGQKSENFCGATQIDNCLSAHDAPLRVLPNNGGIPSGSTCFRVRSALRSPFGKRLSAALAPSGSSLGEILLAYSSASTVSSWLGLYSGQTGLSSVFFSKPTKFLGYPDACKWRAHML